MGIMRKALLVTLVLVVGVVAFAIQQGYISFDLNAGVCRDDREVDTATREGAANAARAFYEALLKSDIDASYAMLAAKTRENVPRLQFEDITRQILARGPYNDLRVERSYHPSLTGMKPARALCGTISNGDWVSLAALPGATQAHVVMSARTRNNGWAFTAWLVRGPVAWEIYGFYTAMADMVGHEQDQRGHGFNAHMLFVAANSTVDRGPDFQLGIQNETDKALADHAPPAELSGKPPFTWRFGEESFTVNHVSIAGIDNALALIIQVSDPTWSGGDVDAETRNRRFIDALLKAHPELKESFGILVARLSAPNRHTTWGTVYNTAKGYLEGENDKTNVQ
jgi:hypothetical protein